MKRDREALIAACRADNVPEGRFGDWQIIRKPAELCLDYIDLLSDDRPSRKWIGGFPSLTMLRRLHPAKPTDYDFIDRLEVVMEDSRRELSRHLPILMVARGRVLVTGLGLGCVVRGLLSLDEVERVDVVEIDPLIADHVWPEFARDDRAHLHIGDALKVEWSPGTAFDFAWHDIWCPHNAGLDSLHAKLFVRLLDLAKVQGAWQFHRLASRRAAPFMPMLNGKKRLRRLGWRSQWREAAE